MRRSWKGRRPGWLRWHIQTLASARAPGDADAEALDRLRARKPEGIVARAVFVPASPPWLPTPEVAIDVLVPDEARFTQLRSLCEVALGADRGSVSLQLNMIGFFAPRTRPDLPVPAPSTAEFLAADTFVYGWFRHLAVSGDRVAARDDPTED